jgi:hypothetical protein
MSKSTLSKVLIFGVALPLLVLTLVLSALAWAHPERGWYVLPVAVLAIVAANVGRVMRPKPATSR